METLLLPATTPEALAIARDRAVHWLREGEVVALPTETVYGLAGDATRAEAVAKIFEAKERPLFDPLIVHLPDRGWLGRVARADDVMVMVEELAAAYWPGPLTLVLPRWTLLPDLVTSGLDTVAVRMSAHPVFSDIVRAFGRPLAAPSANRFGRISPTTGQHAMAELAGRIPLIVDAGPARHGLESTVVRVEPGKLVVLRAGPITREELETFAEVEVAGPAEKPQAPGQLASHYAPRTRLVLLRMGEQVEPSERAGLLAFQGAPATGFGACEVLSRTGDLREAAAALFAMLRRLDAAGLERIYAEPVPEHGLGAAIMDRLRRASASRA
jgi:L-threonylcarbamoyladenylate synthase